MRNILETRPACCAAAGFAAVSFIGFYAAADADPKIAGAVKLAAALVFFAAGVIMSAIAALTSKDADAQNASGSQSPQAASCGLIKEGAARRRRLYASIAALLFACSAAAVLSQLHFGRPASLLEKYGDGAHTVTFTVLELERMSSYDASYYVEVSAINDKSVGMGRVYALLEADYILDLELYKVYTLGGLTLSLPEYATLSEAAYGASRGIMLTLGSSEDPGVLTPQGERAILWGLFKKLNTTLSQRLVFALGKDAGGFAACLLLGRWDYLTGTFSRDFRALGILHLLAISGEHLSILLGALDILLRGLNKYIRYVILSAGALLILALTGMSPAVARASVMAVLYYSAFLLRRRADALTSLSAAVAIILAVNPAAAADVGLLMSAAATLGIITAGRELTQRGRPRLRALAFLRENIVNSLCATVFTLPVSWIVSGEFSPLAPLVTLLFSLPMTALLYIVPPVLIFFGTPICAPLGYAAAVLYRIVSGMSTSLAPPLSGTVVSLRYPFVWVAFAAAAAVLMILPRMVPVFSGGAGVLASAGMFAAVFAASLFVWSLTEARIPKVIYYNNGVKNEMLVVGCDGATLVCDISDGTYTPLKNAARLARARFCATKFEGYMLTHLHRRHVMQYMRLASRNFVDTLLLPTPQTDDERYIALALESAAAEYGSRVVYYNAAENTHLDFASLMISLPKRLYIKRSTHPTIALHISGRGTGLLYVGGGNGEVPDERRVLLESWAVTSKCIVFGAHSPAYYGTSDTLPFSFAELAVYPSAEVRESYGIKCEGSSRTVVLEETGHNSIEIKFRPAS